MFPHSASLCGFEFVYSYDNIHEFVYGYGGMGFEFVYDYAGMGFEFVCGFTLKGTNDYYGP